MPCLSADIAIVMGKRGKLCRVAADDRERHRQTQLAGTHDGVERAADAEPDRQTALFDPGIDAGALERRERLPRPTDMFRGPRSKQQVKLFVEQRLVLVAWPTE